MTRHRIRVVAAGLLLVMASLTLLPVTSGAGMIKFRDPSFSPVYPAGDPDGPGNGRMIRVLPGWALYVGNLGSYVPLLWVQPAPVISERLPKAHNGMWTRRYVASPR
jgi:hypothetical protein